MAGRPKKYTQFVAFLEQKAGECRRNGIFDFTIRFEDLRKSGIDLPPSAYKYREWWANTAARYGSGAKLKPWQQAGLETANVELNSRQLTFRYKGEFAPEIQARRDADMRRSKEAELRALRDKVAVTPTGIFAKVNRQKIAKLEQELGATPTVQVKGMADVSRPYAVAPGVQTDISPRCRHPIYGALKGYIRLVAGTDLTQPADPEWGQRIWGKDSE
jgi:hypothetical protein